MPTYDYKCECGNEFEFMQPIIERATATCDNCGKKAKMIMGKGAPGIKVSEGTSPSRPSGRPKDAIPLGDMGYAVPRKDKRGNPVKLRDLKGKDDLPKDMQANWDKKSEKDRRQTEEVKKQKGNKAKIKKHHEGKFNKK